MLEIDADNYRSEVTENQLPVVVDFWGPRCAPCLALTPQVEKLAEEYEGRVEFAKINVAENRRLALDLKVLGVPSVLFFFQGAEKARITGGDVTVPAIRAGAERLLCTGEA